MLRSIRAARKIGLGVLHKAGINAALGSPLGLDDIASNSMVLHGSRLHAVRWVRFQSTN
jgi:hypothetical protein